MNAMHLLFAATMALVAPQASSIRANSPDGRHVVYIMPNGAGDAEGSGSQLVVISDIRTGAKRRLLTSRYDGDAHRNLTNLAGPLFSLDGDFVYVTSSDVAPTSGAVHRIDPRSGAVRFVVGGQALSVLRTGPYRGHLLVQQHRYRDQPEGGSYNPVFVVRPDGHVEFMIPGSDTDDGELAVQPWLARRKWRAW